MFTFIIILITIIAILITFVVLIQSGKGGGLAGIASGGATTQILGARQAPDVLEKATWLLATLFIMFCVLSNFAIGTGDAQESVIQQRTERQQSGQQPLPPAGEQELPGQQVPPGAEQNVPQQQPQGSPEGGQ